MELEELKTEIEDLHTKRQFSAIKTILNQLNPADIAQLLEEFSNEERLLFFRLLGKEEAADTFVELEPDNQKALIHAFSDNELREVLDELYLDDTVDMIEEMPATVVKRILRNTDVETRASINTLLRYPEDSAGSIMTPEFVDLKRDMTVEDAFKRIRRTGVDKETIYTCYVTDASRHLLGVTTVKELLLHDQDGALYADALVLNKRYKTEDELTARPYYWVSSGYRFAPGEVMQADYQFWGCDKNPYITWERGKLSGRKLVQEPFNVRYIGYYRHEPYSVLNRCELEDSPALRYCQYFGGWEYRPGGPRGYPHKCDDFVSYLTAYCIYPRQIEMLVKAGLYQPVEALVYQRKKFAAAIRWEEPDVRKAMGLTKQELRQVIALQPDFGALECRNYANRHLNAGWSIPDAMDFWNLFWKFDDRMPILRMCRKYRLDVNRLVRYLTDLTETVENLRHVSRNSLCRRLGPMLACRSLLSPWICWIRLPCISMVT